MPREQTNKKNSDKIITKLNKAYIFFVNNPHSSFYKDKYLRAGIKLKSIKTLEDFQSLPYLTKDEILNVSPEDFVFFPKKNISDVGVSSGTTNKDKPLTMLLDMNARPDINFTLFHKPLIDLNIKRHMLLFPTMTAARRLRIHHPVENKDIAYAIGDLGNLPLTAKVASAANIESIETTASMLYLFIPYLKKAYDLRKIKFIMLIGEYCSDQKFKLLQKEFKNARISTEFASVETGNIGYRCEYIKKMPTRFFHLVDFIYPEIVDHQQEGELVVSGLATGKLPYLLRYKTGNHVKLTDFKCKCGNNGLAEIFGKIGYDVLNIQGTYIYSNQIHQILSNFSKYIQTSDFKLHVYEVIKGDKIMIRLILQLISKGELANLDKAKDEINQGMGKLILTPKNTLADLVDKGIYAPLEIEFVQSFPLSPKQTSIISHIV